MSRELFRKSTVGSQHTVTNGAPNYERYEYLASAFYKNDLYRIFAKPVILGRDELGRPSMIRWMTDYDFMGDPVSLTELPPGEQELVKGKVKNIIDQLYREASGHAQTEPEKADLMNILDSCIEVPDDGSINIVRVPDESGRLVDRYVLTQWGFINDDRKAQNGIIKRWTGLRTRNIRVKASYPEGTPAAMEKIFLEYGLISKEGVTDAGGILLLEDVPANVSIHTYQIFENAKQNINNFNTDERTEYPITIHKPQQKSDPVPDPPPPPPPTPLSPAPASGGPLALQFVDAKKRPVPNMPADLTYNGKRYPVRTDAAGKVALKEVIFGRSIDIDAQLGRSFYKGGIVHVAGKDLHVLQMKKKSLWWLWVLLALLALLLLWLLWHFLYPPKPPVGPGDHHPPDSTVQQPVPAGAMQIHVVDSATGESLYNAAVQLDYNNLSAASDSSGRALFPNITKGTKTMATVSMTYYDTARAPVTSGEDNLIKLVPAVKYIAVDTVNHSLGHTSIFVWDIGDNTKQFDLWYDMGTIPDKLEIFAGKGLGGDRLFYTFKPGNPGVAEFVDSFATFPVRNPSGHRYVTVRVTGNDRRTPDGKNFATVWYYTLFNPKMR